MKPGRKQGIGKYEFRDWYSYVPDGCILAEMWYGHPVKCRECRFNDCVWDITLEQKLKRLMAQGIRGAIAIHSILKEVV